MVTGGLCLELDTLYERALSLNFGEIYLLGDFYYASSICVSLTGMENLEWAFDFWLIVIYFVPKLPLLTV